MKTSQKSLTFKIDIVEMEERRELGSWWRPYTCIWRPYVGPEEEITSLALCEKYISSSKHTQKKLKTI